jgi:outer membrane immunogenic protein
MKLESKTATSTALFAAAAAAASATSTGAMAADLALKAPTPVLPTWQGLYVGGSVGASWLNSVQDDSAASIFGYYGDGTRQTASGVGILGGLDIGYNWQDRNFVYGVEADFSWVAGGKASTTSVISGYNADTGNKSSRVQGLATFRGRFGFDIDGTMPYLTAGFAEAQVRNSYSIAYLGAPTTFSNTTTWQPGIVLGGGIEHQFTNHWSVKGEVLWVGLKDTTIPAVPGYAAGGNVQFSNSMVIGRVGLNYRF